MKPGPELAPWRPRFTLSPSAVRSLLDVEAARAVVDHTPVPPGAAEELRRRARLRSTHYSTQIEGNRLTLSEAEAVILGDHVRFHGRERDIREVRNYWYALLQVEAWAAKGMPLTEDRIRRLHALVEHSPRARPTPYRDGQNVIRDSATGALIYHARDLAAYYGSLVTHPHHNYYEGRADADLTPWLEYFLGTLAGVFTSAKEEALRVAEKGLTVQPDALRRLSPRARIALGL